MHTAHPCVCIIAQFHSPRCVCVHFSHWCVNVAHCVLLLLVVESNSSWNLDTFLIYTVV